MARFVVDDIYEPLNLNVQYHAIGIIDMPQLRQYLDLDLLGSWLKRYHPAHVFQHYRLIKLAVHESTDWEKRGNNRYLVLVPLERFNPLLTVQPDEFTHTYGDDHPRSVPQDLVDEWVGRMPDILSPQYFKEAKSISDLQRNLSFALKAHEISSELKMI